MNRCAALCREELVKGEGEGEGEGEDEGEGEMRRKRDERKDGEEENRDE